MSELEALHARAAQKRAIFDAMVTAYGRKEFDAFETYFLPDAVFEWPYLPMPGWPHTMIGVHKFREESEAGMADFEPYGHTVTAFYDMLDPDSLIVEYFSDTVYIPTLKQYSNKYLGIVKFKEDKIIYWKEYINPLIVQNIMSS